MFFFFYLCLYLDVVLAFGYICFILILTNHTVGAIFCKQIISEIFRMSINLNFTIKDMKDATLFTNLQINETNETIWYNTMNTLWYIRLSIKSQLMIQFFIHALCPLCYVQKLWILFLEFQCLLCHVFIMTMCFDIWITIMIYKGY